MDYTINTKEELFGTLHELFEWLDPLKRSIEDMPSRDLKIGETLAIANVMNALQELDDALAEFDRVFEM